MTRLEIQIGPKKHSYHVPQKWDEVSVKQYQQLMSITENKELSELEVKIRSISILTKCPLSYLSKISIKQIDRVNDTLAALTADMPNKELRNVIEIDGIEYGFVPNMNELTFGEFADMDTWIQNGYANLIDILTVLYRPVIKRSGNRYRIEEYTIDDREDRAKIFEDSLSIDTVYGAMVFFYTIVDKHIDTIKSSLEMKKKRSSMEQKKKRRKAETH